MQVIILPGGVMRMLYSEVFDLDTFGQSTITRASHVEPDHCGLWYADLSPVKGPRLGPFRKRSEALTAETDWINHNIF